MKIPDNLIWTRVFWCWKRPLYQLRHSPEAVLSYYAINIRVIESVFLWSHIAPSQTR